VARVETLLDPGSKRRERRRLRLEDRDGEAQRGGTLDQRGVSRAMPIRPADRGADNFGAAIIALGDGDPEQPASPVEIPPRIEVARNRFENLAPRLGATETRQMARSARRPSRITSRIDRQNAAEASSSSKVDSQSDPSSANSRSRRKLTEGDGPSSRSATTPDTPENGPNAAAEHGR
jgi:hypothetical protein